MEINKASGDKSVRGATHYDITMGNYVLGISIVMSQWVMTSFIMYDFYYVLLCLFMFFYYELLVWNKNENKFLFDKSILLFLGPMKNPYTTQLLYVFFPDLSNTHLWP